MDIHNFSILIKAIMVIQSIYKAFLVVKYDDLGYQNHFLNHICL